MRLFTFESFSTKDIYDISKIIKHFKTKDANVYTYDQAVKIANQERLSIYNYVAQQINKLGLIARVINDDFKDFNPLILVNELFKVSISGISSKDKKYIRILSDDRFKKSLVDDINTVSDYVFEDVKQFVDFIKIFLKQYPEFSSQRLNKVNNILGVFEAFVKSHELAGAVLILDNKILLVNSKKYKNIPSMWSIPKGHIEKDMTDIETAISELDEEANIQIEKSKFKTAVKDRLFYIKNGIKKELIYFVIKIQRHDLDFKLYNDMILKYYLNKDEIAEAGFFSKEDAVELLDKRQIPILKHL